MAKAEVINEAPVAPAAPTALPTHVIETNFDFTVEDNTVVEEVVVVEVSSQEIPLMDGFTQVNYV